MLHSKQSRIERKHFCCKFLLQHADLRNLISLLFELSTAVYIVYDVVVVVVLLDDLIFFANSETLKKDGGEQSL